MATPTYPNHSPYADPSINRIYNMLFCDDPSAFAPQPGHAPARNVRLNFLVSNGLYFGEGPMDTLNKDTLAGPLLQVGGQLIGQLADLAQARA